jgi:hypothetical protein
MKLMPFPLESDQIMNVMHTPDDEIEVLFADDQGQFVFCKISPKLVFSWRILQKSSDLGGGTSVQNFLQSVSRPDF